MDQRLLVLAKESTTAVVEVQARRDEMADLRRKQAELATTQESIDSLRTDIRTEEANLVAIQERVHTARLLSERAAEINAGMELLNNAREELDRLESTRRQHGQLQERRTHLRAVIDRAEASLTSERSELQRRIVEDLEPLAQQSKSLVVRLSDLAAKEKSLDAEQAAIERRTEEVAGPVGQHRRPGKRTGTMRRRRQGTARPTTADVRCHRDGRAVPTLPHASL